MANGEAVEFAGGGVFGDGNLPDITAHLLLERFDQVLHLPIRPLHHQLDPPIGQISHKSLHIVLESQILNRIPKPHSLNSPGEMTRATMKWRCDWGS